MNRTFFILFAMSLLFSCHRKELGSKKLILGEWKFVSQVNKTEGKATGPLIVTPVFASTSYSFLPNNVCEDKKGFFTERRYNLTDPSYWKYLGTSTTYKIEGDSLKILDLSENKWNAKKIISVTQDTLILEQDTTLVLKFSKFQYTIRPEPLFDQIIVSASGCFGTCPVDEVSIRRSGEVLYNGRWYTGILGFYQGKINEKDFAKIEFDFKKANVLALKDKYEASWTDDEEISVTFIKNNRIVKTIRDYGRVAPAEFNWAYTPVRYLYQKLNLSKISKQEYIAILHK